MLCSIFSSQVWRAAGLEPKAVGTRLLVHQEEEREAEEERAREAEAEAEEAARARRAGQVGGGQVGGGPARAPGRGAQRGGRGGALLGEPHEPAPAEAARPGRRRRHVRLRGGALSGPLGRVVRGGGRAHPAQEPPKGGLQAEEPLEGRGAPGGGPPRRGDPGAGRRAAGHAPPPGAQCALVPAAARPRRPGGDPPAGGPALAQTPARAGRELPRQPPEPRGPPRPGRGRRRQACGPECRPGPTRLESREPPPCRGARAAGTRVWLRSLFSAPFPPDAADATLIHLLFLLYIRLHYARPLRRAALGRARRTLSEKKKKK